jgi:hypothetical protein
VRDAPSAVKTFLASTNAAWRADLITLGLLDGSGYRWTTCDMPLTSGGNTYASGPVVSRTLRLNCRGEEDTLSLELVGAYLINGAPLAKLGPQGFFDDARIQIDHVIGAYPGDLSLGVISSWFEGRVAGLEPTATGVRLEAKGDFEELSILQIPRFVFSRGCGYAVYDPLCSAGQGGSANMKSAFTVSGSVASGATPTTTTFRTSITNKADSHFNLGVLAFASNTSTVALRGVRKAVRSYIQSNGVMTLALPLPVAPAVGDTFTVFPGCKRDLGDCAKFSNLAAFRGFPHIPASEGAL